MQGAIRTPGSIWAKLIEANNEKSKKPDGRGDAFVFFVGARGSGKSTLLNRFLYPSRVEVPKPSEGLEYTYARKPSNYDHERKDLAHIWEIGGSQEFAEEIMQGDQLFLTAKQVTTAVVVVVVDLSDPSSVLVSLLYWLEQIKKKLGSTYEKFEKKGLQLPEQLRQRAKGKLYSQNEDKDLVYHSGVALVIAATKYDAMAELEPEQKKVIGRTLRYIAHAHGAFLTYLGNLHTGSESTDTAGDKALLDNFSKLMNHLIFIGLEKKPALKMSPQLDHNMALMVPAGADRFKDIGRPRGGVDDNLAVGLQEWKDIYDKMFTPKDMHKRKSKFVIDEQFKDDEIDIIKERKLQELEAYRKDQEAAKEAARKRLLLAKAQQQEAAKKDGAKKEGAAKRTSASGGAAAGTKPAAKPAAKASAKPAADGAANGKAAAAANGDAAAPAPKPAAKPAAKPKLPAPAAAPTAA